jgi:hypothetical protein
LRLLRAPLFHFLLLGAALFLLFSWVRDRPAERSDAIVFTQGDVQRWADIWQEALNRPPTPGELDGIIEEQIRAEVFYREAVAMGLDRDDDVIRRRLQQKMEFLAAELGGVAEPTEAQLQTYLDEHAQGFKIDPVLSFRQIYLNVEKRGEAAVEDAGKLLAILQGGKARDITTLGDEFSLPQDYDAYPLRDVVRLFGPDFADGLPEFPQGRWAGPLQSVHGLHLVLLQERIAARSPELDEVRNAVWRAWLEARRQEALDAFYLGLRQRYVVKVERPD